MCRCNGLQTRTKDSPIKVGNIVGGGVSQGGSTYLVTGICPSLVAGMSHGNVMPFIVEVRDVKATRKHM